MHPALQQRRPVADLATTGPHAAEMWADLDEGAELFSALWNASVPHAAVENPLMHRHAKERIRGYARAAPDRSAMVVWRPPVQGHQSLPAQSSAAGR
jgi:hypothetical protein